MGTKTSLTWGAFAILALLIVGVSYWAIREKSQLGPPATNIAEAPPTPAQTRSARENSPPIEQEKQAAGASPEASPPSTTPAAPSPTPAAPPTTAGSKEVPTPPSSPLTSAKTEQSRESTSAKPPLAAMALAMPDEDKMSEANRRQVQQALHGLGYYNGWSSCNPPVHTVRRSCRC